MPGDLPDKAAAAMMDVEIPGPLGVLRCMRSPLRMSATPPGPTLPPVPLGTHPAEWLPRD
jgi:crotonobetainyl-CoA:carnitine CoA-transferase CaiB-like acyl-CoA transferase